MRNGSSKAISIAGSTKDLNAVEVEGSGSSEVELRYMTSHVLDTLTNRRVSSTTPNATTDAHQEILHHSTLPFSHIMACKISGPDDE
jgi:hypothetical protein